MISYNSYCMNLILLEAPWKIVAIEWADSSLPRFCRGSAQIRSDFWVYFPVDSTGPAADSTRVRCGPKNLWQIRHKYAAEWWTFWSKKKPKKSASPPKESKSVGRGLFSILADCFGGPESSCLPWICCGCTRKIPPIIVGLKGPLKKSILNRHGGLLAEPSTLKKFAANYFGQSAVGPGPGGHESAANTSSPKAADLSFFFEK